MDSDTNKMELAKARKDVRSMVQFFKTLWDEIDAQFQGFEREEKIQIFSSVLQASMMYGAKTDEESDSRIEELLRMAEDTEKRKPFKRPR